MKLSEMAELAASDSKNVPKIIKMMAESMENTDTRLQSIENAIRELAPKIGNMNTQVLETVNNISQLKKQIATTKDDTAVLKTWLNETTMESVAKIDANNDMVLVKKKNDGMLPNDRTAAKTAQVDELKQRSMAMKNES
jgi:hypothetical protein